LVKAPEGGLTTDQIDVLRPALWAGIFLGLALLLVLAIAVVAAVSNKTTPLLVLAGMSALLLLAAYIAFGRFSATLLAPDFNLLSFFGSGVILSLVGAFVHLTVDVICLDKGVSMLFVILGALVIWTAAFIVTADKEKGTK
jgi:hypothetical protein